MKLLAIYPGTFDPPTLGHADIIERAHQLFDEVIVAVGRNTSKSPLLTVDERIEALNGISKPFSCSNPVNDTSTNEIHNCITKNK